MLPSKRKTLIRQLSFWQPGAIAFSGGVDSTLLLALAREAWDRPPLAVTFISPLLLPDEQTRIRELVGFLDLPLKWIPSREYQDPRFRKNTPSRCYHCKKHRFRLGNSLVKKMGLPYLLDGTNADDLKHYRPGIRAAREARVFSPLAAAGWTKAEIRRTSRQMGLPNWDLPSSPCLATRIAYGQPITRPLLKRLAQGEAFLHQMGLKETRLRVHGALIRVEVTPENFSLVLDKKNRAALLAHLSGLGFDTVTLDLKGFRSGSMDESRPGKRKRNGPA